MRRILGILLLSLGMAFHPQDSQGVPLTIEVSTTSLTIPTYPYADFLEVRHSATYNMDYSQLKWGDYEGSGPLPSPQAYTALVVENPWLKLTFLPELGGRLYGVTDKTTGEELLYQNPVIKPTHWGPPEQGWWLAVGGIEWCLPVEEHGYEWGVPWSYNVATTAAGATVTLWDTTATDRVRARITVYLPADQAAFIITPRLENPTGAPVAFKFWDNAMLAPGANNTVGGQLRFVIPIDQVTVHSRGDDNLPGDGQPMSWPVYQGTDYSQLGNWNQWLGFFARPQAAQDWAGIYAEGVRRGVARVFPHQVAVGVKGFGLGWQHPIDYHLWTDDPGTYYVELHGGPSPTFWDTVTLDPGQALEWTETWLPVRDLPVLSLATADLALGIKASGEDLELGVVLAGGGNGVGLRLWHKVDCDPLWRQDGLDLTPGQAYTHQLPGIGLKADQVVLGVLEGNTAFLSGDLVCPAPTSQVNPLGTVQPAADFVVHWSGTDPGGVLTGYDVQVRDGDTEAPWTDWLIGYGATSALFHGQAGHTYTFRSRARDLFGRVEDWPANDWQDTFTTVLLEPAPMLITSAKVAQPLCVLSDDIVEFQIKLNNTGNLAANADVTDTLPANLALTAGPWIAPPLPPPTFSNGTIQWNGTLAAGEPGATIGFEAQVLEVQPGEAIVNAASIDDGVHPVLRRQVTLKGCQYVYLPLILRE